MATSDPVFDWKRLSTWCLATEEIVPADLRPHLLSRISQSAAQFTHVDDTCLFEELYGELGDYELLLDRFADKFPAAFPALRMYHGCRCLDPQSYYERGIQILNAAAATKSFADIYLDHPQLPGITPADIDAAAHPLLDSDRRRDGYAYFGLDDRHLLHRCKQYFTHGSEFLQALAANLQQRWTFDIQEDLARRGQPTVFCVRMPVNRLTYQQLRELGENAFYAWAYGIARNTRATWEIDFSVEIRAPLSASDILEHYFPPGF